MPVKKTCKNEKKAKPTGPSALVNRYVESFFCLTPTPTQGYRKFRTLVDSDLLRDILIVYSRMT